MYVLAYAGFFKKILSFADADQYNFADPGTVPIKNTSGVKHNE